jgi:hypothetical protein
MPTDNTQINQASSNGDIIATEVIGAAKYQNIKLVIGDHGINGGDVSAANPMPVTVSASRTVTAVFNAVTTNQTSAAFPFPASRKTLQDTVTGTGAVGATISWYGNNFNVHSGGVLLATSTLSGTTTNTSGADMPAVWPYIYAVLSGISGTGAAVTSSVAT